MHWTATDLVRFSSVIVNVGAAFLPAVCCFLIPLLPVCCPIDLRPIASLSCSFSRTLAVDSVTNCTWRSRWQFALRLNSLISLRGSSLYESESHIVANTSHGSEQKGTQRQTELIHIVFAGIATSWQRKEECRLGGSVKSLPVAETLSDIHGGSICSGLWQGALIKRNVEPHTVVLESRAFLATLC
jgi:hypothetical protein